MRLKWPLTGRAEELRIIQTALSASELAGIVISGAAGVGKSRLAREALSAAASTGCETRWAVGTTSARTLPLGAFTAWVDPAATDPLRMVRGAIDSLTSAAGTTVVVGVDDAHLLDDLSTFVLHQIILRGAAKIVLTVRDGDRVCAGINELWKAGQLDRLALQPLSRDETTVLLAGTLGGPLDPDAAQRLWRLTRGNVLYLRNIVEQEVVDGRLVQQLGCWRWVGAPVVPPGLAEMIESRIGAMPAAVRDVVDALAVGEPIELASLSRITDAGAVEDADTHGLITLDRAAGRTMVRVAHPLYAEVRRERAPATRLRRLRGLVATELAARGGSDDLRTVVRRAALSLDSDLTPDAQLLIRAAEGAVMLADLPLADRLAQAAIRAGGPAEASIVRAHVLSLRSRGAEANAVLADISTDGGAERARVAFLRANNMLWTLADPSGAKQLIEAALRITPSGARACLDAFMMEYWAAMGTPEEVRRAAGNLAAEPLPSFVDVVTRWALTIAAGAAGQTTEAAAHAEAGYEIAGGAYDAAHMRFVIADAHVCALLMAGQIAKAGDVAAQLRRHARNLSGASQLYSAAVSGRAALAAGRLDTACSLLKMVVGVLTASGETIGWGYRCQIPHTIALAMLGFTEQAVAASATLEKQRHPGWRCVDYERELARAWVAAAQGSVSEAVEVLVSAAETAAIKGQFGAETICLQTLTQFGDPSGAARLGELTAVVEGPRAGLAAKFAAALQRGEPAALATVSEELESMGDQVAAGDAAAHAAIEYRRRGQLGSAYACGIRAGTLAEQCGGARTPALRRVTDRLPLTQREREIVMLISEGLSNRAVAERLTLSVRTVEGHLYRAMEKTGASSREELAALLLRRRQRSRQ